VVLSWVFWQAQPLYLDKIVLTLYNIKLRIPRTKLIIYMDNNKLILPVSILLACIILGGFYCVTEIYRQQSIGERQQAATQEKQVELQTAAQEKQTELQMSAAEKQAEQAAAAERAAAAEKQAQQEAAAQQAAAEKQAAQTKAHNLSACLAQAEADYQSSIRTNPGETVDAATQSILDNMKIKDAEYKQSAINTCYAEYSN
jgi:membrane protein involved in colicin uptake